MADLTVTINCPNCAHQTIETMPTDRCVFFYECGGCGAVVKPKPGDCCVYCSYGDKRCPFIQDSRRVPASPDRGGAVRVAKHVSTGSAAGAYAGLMLSG